MLPSPSLFRLVLTAGVALGGGARAACAQVESTRWPIVFAVTNEQMDSTRIVLQANGAVLAERVIGRPRDLSGVVLMDTLRLPPGEHRLEVFDARTGQRVHATLNVRDEEMFILVRIIRGKLSLSAGHGRLYFM